MPVHIVLSKIVTISIPLDRHVLGLTQYQTYNSFRTRLNRTTGYQRGLCDESTAERGTALDSFGKAVALCNQASEDSRGIHSLG